MRLRRCERKRGDSRRSVLSRSFPSFKGDASSCTACKVSSGASAILRRAAHAVARSPRLFRILVSRAGALARYDSSGSLADCASSIHAILVRGFVSWPFAVLYLASAP